MTLLSVRIRVAGVGNRARSVRFAWQATWYVAGHRFYVAGAGNRAWQLRRPDFAALCEEATACTRVGLLLGAAKAWQARGVRGFVEVQACSRRFAERSGRLTQLAGYMAARSAKRSGGLRAGAYLGLCRRGSRLLTRQRGNEAQDRGRSSGLRVRSLTAADGPQSRRALGLAMRVSRSARQVALCHWDSRRACLTGRVSIRKKKILRI